MAKKLTGKVALVTGGLAVLEQLQHWRWRKVSSGESRSVGRNLQDSGLHARDES